jgi:cytochrome c-type biogenesis protein CcmF
VMLSVWLLSSLLISLRQRHRNTAILSGLKNLLRTRGNGSYFGMVIAHFGVAVFIIGITFVTQFEQQQDVRMSPGQTYEMSGYTFRFDGVQGVPGPNYRAERASIHLSKDNREIDLLHPEKRTYTVQTKPMTESGINIGLFRDIYVSLGEDLGNGDWSLRLYYKPFIRWIWLGGILIAIGGVLAALDRRYRLALRKPAPAASPQRTGTVASRANA